MLKLTKTGIGLLTKQYRSVLRKCLLLNLGLFSSLVVLYNCALAMEMGSFEYSDAAYGASSAFADNGYMIPSKAYMTQGTGGVFAPWWMYSSYAHSVISSSATVAQNLERIDAIIGAFGFSTNGVNSYFFATMRNEPTSTINKELPIMTDLINLDHVLGALPSGTYVSNMQSMGDNVKALDTAIGAKIASDGHYIKKSDTNSITANLSALDYALYNYYYTFRDDKTSEVIEFAEENDSLSLTEVCHA